MKAQPKAAAKAKKPAAPKAKVAPKPVAKKAAVKAPVKKTPAAKAPAKPAAKAKPVAKAVPKPAAKPAVKAAAKSAPAKPAGKSAVAKVAAKAVAAVKNLVKSVKPAVKPTPAAKTAAEPTGKSAPASKAAAAPASPHLSKPHNAAPSGAAAQSGRRTAAPAAPAVTPAWASAKASYTPMASTSLTPPPVVQIKKDPKLANNWKSKSAEELNDDEVLAMPDTEYMNDKQMAFFRLKLLKLKEDILNSAGETTEHLREETVIVPDPADRATIEEEHALELRTRDRERKLLKKIEQSIARIDAGDYGYCDETGEPIGVGRLLARPTATLSLEAQQRRELKQKMFGD